MELEHFRKLVQEAAIEVGGQTGLQFGPVVYLDQNKDFIRIARFIVMSANDRLKFPYASRFSITWLWLHEASVYNSLARYFTRIVAKFKAQSGR
jgi:hypothetical protein